MSSAQARQELIREAGRQFDPGVVEVVLGVLDELGNLDDAPQSDLRAPKTLVQG